MDKIDREFPVFVLATVIIERKKYISDVIPQLNQLKLRYWDHEGINLHSRDIRKSKGAFSFLQNHQFRVQFMDELSSLMASLPYTLFIVGIDKKKHRDRYGCHAENPYELALTYSFERISHFLKSQEESHLPVIAEARGNNEDRDLEAAFYKMLSRGTSYISAKRFSQLQCPLLFKNKRENIIGVQIADLCAYPSARKMLQPNEPNRAYKIVKEHLYNVGGVSGWKVFP